MGYPAFSEVISGVLRGWLRWWCADILVKRKPLILSTQGDLQSDIITEFERLILVLRAVFLMFRVCPDDIFGASVFTQAGHVGVCLAAQNRRIWIE